MIDVVV